MYSFSEIENIAHTFISEIHNTPLDENILIYFFQKIFFFSVFSIFCMYSTIHLSLCKYKLLILNIIPTVTAACYAFQTRQSYHPPPERKETKFCFNMYYKFYISELLFNKRLLNKMQLYILAKNEKQKLNNLNKMV